MRTRQIPNAISATTLLRLLARRDADDGNGSKAGKGRIVSASLTEDRIRISKRPWRVWDREKTSTAAIDPETNHPTKDFSIHPAAKRCAC